MPLTPDDDAALIEIVRRAAQAHILPRFRALTDGAVETKSNAHDLVTIADREAEAAMTTAIHEALPGALVVGEEAAEDDPDLIARIATAPRAVILDPVDGTWNFAAGLAVFGVILAVTEGGKTMFGLLYDAICDDWVLARRGGGTWFCRPDQTPQRLTIPPHAPEALAVLGSTNYFAQAHHAQVMSALHEACRHTSYRCSCQEYRLMCAGKADLSLSGLAKPWDHAAGILAVQEAGGVAGCLDGMPYRPGVSRGPLLAARSQKAFAAGQARFGFLLEG